MSRNGKKGNTLVWCFCKRVRPAALCTSAMQNIQILHWNSSFNQTNQIPWKEQSISELICCSWNFVSFAYGFIDTGWLFWKHTSYDAPLIMIWLTCFASVAEEFYLSVIDVMFSYLGTRLSNRGHTYLSFCEIPMRQIDNAHTHTHSYCRPGMLPLPFFSQLSAFPEFWVMTWWKVLTWLLSRLHRVHRSVMVCEAPQGMTQQHTLMKHKSLLAHLFSVDTNVIRCHAQFGKKRMMH